MGLSGLAVQSGSVCGSRGSALCALRVRFLRRESRGARPSARFASRYFCAPAARAAVRGGSPAPFGSQSSVLRLLSSPEDDVGTRWLCGWSRDYFWVSEAGGVGVCWVPSAACQGVIAKWLANKEDSAGCVRVTGVDAGR